MCSVEAPSPISFTVPAPNPLGGEGRYRISDVSAPNALRAVPNLWTPNDFQALIRRGPTPRDVFWPLGPDCLPAPQYDRVPRQLERYVWGRETSLHENGPKEPSDRMARTMFCMTLNTTHMLLATDPDQLDRDAPLFRFKCVRRSVIMAEIPGMQLGSDAHVTELLRLLEWDRRSLMILVVDVPRVARHFQDAHAFEYAMTTAFHVRHLRKGDFTPDMPFYRFANTLQHHQRKAMADALAQQARDHCLHEFLPAIIMAPQKAHALRMSQFVRPPTAVLPGVGLDTYNAHHRYVIAELTDPPLPERFSGARSPIMFYPQPRGAVVASAVVPYGGVVGACRRLICGSFAWLHGFGREVVTSFYNEGFPLVLLGVVAGDLLRYATETLHRVLWSPPRRAVRFEDSWLGFD